MQELFERLLDDVRGAWRFRWPAMAVAWGICLIGWAVVLLLPDTYAASARVFVDTRTPISQVTQGLAVETSIDTQIYRVRQALLGGPALERVAEETGLTADARTPQQKQHLMMRLRERIEISASSSGGSGGVYVISYTDTLRSRSLKVVDRLLKTFVGSTIGGKREGSEEAQRFLVAQISDYERRLAAAEDRLAEFKRENVALMPGTQGDYFTRLQAESEALDRAGSSLAIALRRRGEIQRQLGGEHPFLAGDEPSAVIRPLPMTRLASAGPVTAGMAAKGVSGADLVTRIREVQVRLDELLLRFTDKHPDVLALRETLAELQRRQSEQIEAIRRGDPAARAELGLNANPIFQSIQLELNQTDVQIATLRGEIADRQAKVAELQRLVDTAPQIEAQFARLNRDYDVTHAQYQALLERLERARLGEEMEASGVFKFEVIDPPFADFGPVAPDRKLLVLFVLCAGVGAGGGLAYLLHRLRPVFFDSRQLGAVTGLPVLGSVSRTWFETTRAQACRAAFAFAGAAAMLLCLSLLVIVGQYRAVRLVHGLLG